MPRSPFQARPMLDSSTGSANPTSPGQTSLPESGIDAMTAGSPGQAGAQDSGVTAHSAALHGRHCQHCQPVIARHWDCFGGSFELLIVSRIQGVGQVHLVDVLAHTQAPTRSHAYNCQACRYSVTLSRILNAVLHGWRLT